ncbi:MAG: hypothetical protein KGQ52_02850 [Alphaproteobacteria bacterium]|nr:hypothetical protein [Alphaproteobacteria bacterium]
MFPNPVAVENFMPDNVTAPAVGVAFATDEIAGVHWPFAKLAFGAADAALRVADADGFRLPVSLGGSLPGFAATPTFNIGTAPTLAVAGPLTDAQLRSAAVPVAVQALATTTRAYEFAAGQRITTAGSGQVRSAAVAASEVLLHASVRGFFRVGDASVAASVGAGSIPLAADEKFHLRITSGQFISFVRDGAADGSLTIMPVLQ